MAPKRKRAAVSDDLKDRCQKLFIELDIKPIDDTLLKDAWTLAKRFEDAGFLKRAYNIMDNLVQFAYKEGDVECLMMAVSDAVDQNKMLRRAGEE